MNSVLSLQFTQTPQFDRPLSEMYNYRPGPRISDTEKMIYIQRIFIRKKTCAATTTGLCKGNRGNLFISVSRILTHGCMSRKSLCAPLSIETKY